MHIPVLLKEVIQYLEPKPNQNFIDCTIGGGGQALTILKLIEPNGKLLGIDLSREAIEELAKIKNSLDVARDKQKPNIKNRLILVSGNFVNIKQIITKTNFGPIHGILLDLGLSTDLLEGSKRGFSFSRDEILDMRFNPERQTITAEQILNRWPKKELLKIFREYGEEKFSKRIAQKIIERRAKLKIKTTFQLVDLIKESLGPRFHIKSLARIFQALRITVNDELENLKKVLPEAVKILEPGGRIAVISYHSLEDRIVKNFFRSSFEEMTPSEVEGSSFDKLGPFETPSGLSPRDERLRNPQAFEEMTPSEVEGSEPKLQILTKKPIQPGKEEINKNPRARSAKLRAAIKILNLKP